MKGRMKFKWKIFIFAISIYILSLSVISVVITENNYFTSIRRAIKQTLDEEINIIHTAILYIKINQEMERGSMEIEKYSSRLVDMFKSKDRNIIIFNDKLEIKAATISLEPHSIEEGLDKALQGKKSYMLKWIDNRHYLIINDSITIGEEKLIITFIQDISHINLQKKDQYRFFIIVGITGLLIVIIATGIMVKILTKPLENLKEASQKIALGNYHDRLRADSNDEIGELAKYFNIMAKEIERKINVLREEGERKQRFIDNLTHEMRTPLTSIIGYSDTLMNIKYDEKTFYKGLRFIYTEGKRMLNMVNQLMDLILLRKNSFEAKEENLKELLESVKEIMNDRIKRKNIKIEVIGEDIQRNLNRDLIKGALMNLLDNAINASSNGDKIILGIEGKKDHDIVFVKDEGRGMSNENIKRAFEPYYRADKSRSRKNGGAGLGLSIANEIIKLHNGSLKIESKLGEGTKVMIIFPRK